MKRLYNEVAGQDIQRLSALTDGIFAFAMTLLALDIHVPDAGAIHSESDLLHAFIALGPRFLVCLMTFLTLGIFWVGQQTHLDMFKRGDRNVAWIHIAFMFAVVLTPFSTGFLATFITYRIALLVYWFNILALGAVLFASYRYANRRGLLRDDRPLDMHTVERRIIVAQSLYAVGAALCLVNTYVSIAVIFLVQLNYAIAPRIPWLYRL
ncbi:MAG TPA: TMEM175 family protein [Candidatus Baltobacteraceae bacterium]|jgi:uncharacterized membrane protein|nr:TMEM175 family protein [Candidatus Baltobacteraceae bacterium]